MRECRSGGWASLPPKQAYLLSAMRHVDDVVLCDVVKSGALSIHNTWTALINPMTTTKAEIEDLIFTRGVHLEAKLSASQLETRLALSLFLQMQMIRAPSVSN